MTTARHFEILVEEESAKALLDALLPRILPRPQTFVVHPYQGKHDLLKRLGQRLRGYEKRPWEDRRIIVVVDRDHDNCLTLKEKMEREALEAKLVSKSRAQTGPWQIASRIVIEELEAWYFGDWHAVCAAYPKVSPKVPRRARYRNADAISGGTWEALERILKRHGYFKNGLRKVEMAQTIAEHMVPSRNTSRSFAAFIDVIT